MRILKSMEEKYRAPALELVEAVFTAHESEEEGRLVRSLVEEIRAGRFYLPELELIMVDSDTDAVLGYGMFSRFHLEGKYEEELLLLSPVAVKTELQRQHISKALIEYGFEKARALGYKAVIVEGNPQNYRSRGFVTSAPYGITAQETVGLPAPERLLGGKASRRRTGAPHPFGVLSALRRLSPHNGHIGICTTLPQISVDFPAIMG